jgi:hypothetical protein
MLKIVFTLNKMSVYSTFLKKAMEVQEEDALEMEKRSLLPNVKTATSANLDFARSKERGELNSQAMHVSKVHELNFRQALESEKLARELFKQEISSIHVSGTRDLNTK